MSICLQDWKRAVADAAKSKNHKPERDPELELKVETWIEDMLHTQMDKKRYEQWIKDGSVLGQYVRTRYSS